MYDALSLDEDLELIDKIVREAACPVIVFLHARDPDASGRHPSAASPRTVSNRKLIDLATAVVDGHRLLPRRPDTSA